MDTTKQPEERPRLDHQKFANNLAREYDQTYECANALFGLAQFAAWWTDFKKSECEGIEASFELKDNLRVEFLLTWSFYKFKFACYLTNLTPNLIDGHVLSNLQVGIWKMRNAEKTARELGTYHFNDATAYTNNVSSNVPGIGNPPAKPTPTRISTP